MARRVETWLVGSAGWLVASVLTGCYTHHTADEELINIPFPAELYGDASVGAATDAGQPQAHDAGSCASTNAIEMFICGLSAQPSGTTGTTGTTGTAGQPSLTDLISLFGGNNTGTTGTTGTTGQPSLTDLISLFGGGTNANNPMGGTTTPPRRDAGTGITRPGGVTTMPTAAECAAATDQLTKLLCMMQGRGMTGMGTTPVTPANPPPMTTMPPAPAVEVDAAAPAAPAATEDGGAPVMPI